MSALDVALYSIFAVIVGGIVLWFLFYAFSGRLNCRLI